jgi:hypothetical protein
MIAAVYAHVTPTKQRERAGGIPASEAFDPGGANHGSVACHSAQWPSSRRDAERGERNAHDAARAGPVVRVDTTGV